VLDPVAVALKFGFLAVLYLFLLWVAWSAVRDLRRGRRPTETAAAAIPSDATGFHTASSGLAGEDQDADPRLEVERAPGHDPGMSYEIGEGAVLGRGNVEIKLEDPFASSRHARLLREGPVMVLEDLGSTNGTFLNGEPVDGPQPLHPGDRIRIGDSEFVFKT
jgi:pSer/pThr/pTyr-binding forkhead associated (FHA) protein